MNLTLSNTQNIFLASANNCCMFAGLGSGKTWAGTLWGAIQAIKYPGSVGMIGANNPAQLHSVVVPCLKKHLDALGVDYYIGEAPPWESPYESHVNIVSVQGGSSILLRSVFESGANRSILGTELSWAYLDEVRELDESVYDLVNGRMRNKIGTRLIRMTSTPNGKKGWLFRRLVSAQPPNWQILSGTTMDNRDNLPPGYIENLKSTYSAQQYSQEVLGNWVDMCEGMAFRFDRQRHCCFKTMDMSKPILFGLDLNVSPLVGVIAQHDPVARTMHIFQEIVIHDNAQTRIACEVVGQRYADKFAECWYLCDESGAHRDTRQTETDVTIMDSTMRKLFKRCRCLNGSKPRVQSRYNSVNAMLDPQDGIVRLTVDPTCKELIADMESVSWDDFGKIDKTDPKRTHAGDALGYLVHRLFPVGSDAEIFGLDGSLQVTTKSKEQMKSAQDRGFPQPVGFLDR